MSYTFQNASIKRSSTISEDLDKTVISEESTKAPAFPPLLRKISDMLELENGITYYVQIGCFILTIKSEYYINFSESNYSNISFKQKITSNIQGNAFNSMSKNMEARKIQETPIDLSKVNRTLEGTDVQKPLKKAITNKSEKSKNNLHDSFLHISVNSNIYDCQNFTIPSNKKTTLIGRSSNCDIVLNSNHVSKMHCRIVFNSQSQKWILFDGSSTINSSSGTWLVIKDKCHIKKGQNDFRFGNSKFIIDYV